MILVICGLANTQYHKGIRVSHFPDGTTEEEVVRQTVDEMELDDPEGITTVSQLDLLLWKEYEDVDAWIEGLRET